MSLFKTEFVPKEKPKPAPHPWEKRIQNIYLNKIKYAHNSIRNPYYPKKEKKLDDKTKEQDEKVHTRYVFTVIGNKYTKEFIYCVKLVQGLYKYRSKIFNAPIVKGVTSTEWPIEWNKLRIKYGNAANCLLKQVAVLFNDKFLGGDEELKRVVEKRYIYHLCLDYQKEAVNQFIQYVKASGRPCVYLHISVDDVPIGSLIFMLYSDILPNTCENFLRLCQARKGGYAGTPVHRIVKDGWIQCGGFALKKTELNCENFIIPHDKRGVLCMANDGVVDISISNIVFWSSYYGHMMLRDIDCSTQFFVLLQPAEWMERKYVAFGQLIDGEYTLQKIENLPTWYESPIAPVKIFKCGVLSFDCPDIMINPHARWYINKHIEDLVSLGEFLIQHLMEKVFLEIEFQRQKRKESEDSTTSSDVSLTESSSSVSSETNDVDPKSYDVVAAEKYSAGEEAGASAANTSASFEVKEQIEKPYYLPLTDLPYDSDVDSVYDIKKLLKGDYCLESDLQILSENTKRIIPPKVSYESYIILPRVKTDEVLFSVDLDSDDEEEIQTYLKSHVDRVSFAGDVIRNIGTRFGMLNLFENSRKSELISFNDEDLRRLRLASVSGASEKHTTQSHDRINKLNELEKLEDYKAVGRGRDKKVSIAVHEESEEKIPNKMRQTDLPREEDLEGNLKEEETRERDHKVQVIEPEREHKPVNRRPTSYYVERKSDLSHLYHDSDYDFDELPTLKNYHPHTDSQGALLSGEKLKENTPYYRRSSVPVYENSLEEIAGTRQEERPSRAISPDFGKPIQWKKLNPEHLRRSSEYHKPRPSLSVAEYQQRNKRYQSLQITKPNVPSKPYSGGLRLPGDTPLYLSDASLMDKVTTSNRRNQRKPLQDIN